jgi:hypothetical protein
MLLHLSCYDIIGLKPTKNSQLRHLEFESKQPNKLVATKSAILADCILSHERFGNLHFVI